ncbi:MAG: hypothetical protein HY315_09060 [Acidobacteria bacterium]|nr:hypothetical protein [Acidobacteriota bacterium]
MPASLHRELRELARREGVSINSEVPIQTSPA